MKFRILCLFVLTSLLLFNCATFRRVSAGQVIRKCSFKIESVQLGQIQLSPELFPNEQGSSSLLPNPQVIGLAQQILQGKLTKPLGHVLLIADLRISNPSQSDTLWIREMRGEIRMDSTLTLPYSRTDSMPKAILPGATIHQISISLPIDLTLLEIQHKDSMQVQGTLVVSSSLQGEPTDFTFLRMQPIPKENIAEFIEKTKKNLLESLLGGWIRSFQ